MLTPYDPIRAAREELAGLVDVQRAIAQRERKATQDIAMAEHELDALRKISGYVKISMDILRERIAALEKQRQ